MANTKTKMRLINYFDVWGNAKEGWEVNNLCNEGEIEIDDNWSIKEIVQAIKKFGFFKKHVRMNMIDYDWSSDSMIEFNQKRDGRPICRLEKDWS